MLLKTGKYCYVAGKDGVCSWDGCIVWEEGVNQGTSDMEHASIPAMAVILKVESKLYKCLGKKIGLFCLSVEKVSKNSYCSEIQLN